MREAKERFVLIDKNYKIKKNKIKTLIKYMGVYRRKELTKTKTKQEKSEQLTRTQGVHEIKEPFDQRSH